MAARSRACSVIECHYSLVWFDREQMVVAPREVWRAHDHKPTDVAVRRHVAHLREAPRAQETFAL